MSRITLQPKLAGETRNYAFDFASGLASGETISTKVVTATVYSGTDASPSSIVSGAASSSGSVVTQAITGGVVGVIYELLCTITTSTGQTLLISAALAIIQELP